MNYEDKIKLLNNEDFFTFFSLMKASPRWVHSAGKQAIQIIGLCHHGNNHSALFDPTTLKVHCFSLCNGAMLFHNWVKKTLNLDNPQEAKNFIEDWIDGQNIDFTNRVPIPIEDFVYEERKFEVEDVQPLPGIDKNIIKSLYDNFDYSYDTLKNLVWHTEDKIDIEILQLYNVAYFPKRESIILPHHNINGDIVGLYERSFYPLRREIKKQFPDIPYQQLLKYPRAKYVPLLKEEKYIIDENDKTSWSFPNTSNLYGLHLAKNEIAKTHKAIVFEGAKSVMLARQYGYKNSVATNTFGINEKHISMLINYGAKEIYFAFDKQYLERGNNPQWELYNKKTLGMANKIKDYIKSYRIIDNNNQLDYKDAPIDKGYEIFKQLYENAEPLNNEYKSVHSSATQKKDFHFILSNIAKKANRKKDVNIIREEEKNKEELLNQKRKGMKVEVNVV